LSILQVLTRFFIVTSSDVATSFGTGSSRSNPIAVASGDESQDVDVEDVDLDKMLDINSAIAVEKEIAADTMGTLFAATRNHFLPFVESTTLVLISLLPHYYEGIRKSATDSLLEYIRTFYDLSGAPEWQPGLVVVCLNLSRRTPILTPQ
jgi:importin-4